MNLKRVLRTFFKYKTSTAFSAISLFIAFLGVIIIAQYVSFEKSFDQMHTKSENLYRLETVMYEDKVTTEFGALIKDNVPEVEDVVYVRFTDGMLSTPESNNSLRTTLIYTDDNFFNHFSFDVLEKESADFLSVANRIALTESHAKKVFGNKQVVGQSIMLGETSYHVSAVIADFPKNSSIQANAVASIETFRKDSSYGVGEWNEWSSNLFLKTAPNSAGDSIAKKIGDVPDLAESLTYFMKEFEGEEFFILNPLLAIHFSAANNYTTANKKVLNVLTLLAIILALMGVVNFINFSTSQAFHRVKSISVLHVFGAKRFHTIGQIIVETILFSVVVLALTLLVHAVVHQKVEALFEIDGLGFSSDYLNLLKYLGFSILFGFSAAIYPALFINSSKLTESLKGKPVFFGKGKRFRSTLIVIQFVFAISLIISSIFIEKQLDYWQNYNIGIDKEHVVYLETTNELKKSADAFAEELMKNGDILDYTYSEFIPGNVWMGWGRMVDGKRIQIKCWPVDKRFLSFYDIEIKEGRTFQTETDADINNYIINETAVTDFGWEKPLEQKMNGFDFEGSVIGVAKDFNFADLREDVQPMQFWLTEEYNDVLMLRLRTDNFDEVFSYIKNTATAFDAQNTVEVIFLNSFMDEQYNKEAKLARFVVLISLWAILLALTGILGLVIFMTRDKIKEIGIRRVNGAGVVSVMHMLTKSFIHNVIIAFVIASPIAYYAMNKWLESFAYKTTLSWWVFALAGCSALVIALLTVSWQTFKAARKNPIEALRYE